MKAYKLLKLRKNGTLGPLFINAKQVIPLGVELPAEEHHKKGFKFRPGWHACQKPTAPHLGKKGRVWAEVRLGGAVRVHTRPESQGGVWYTAGSMEVLRLLPIPLTSRPLRDRMVTQ